MACPAIRSLARLSVAAAAALAVPAQAAAQRLPITYYSTADGLPHYAVNRIVRDARGFLWFCTRDGVSRFDGREFVNWGVDDGLPAGDVNALLEAPDGVFWIATERGLVRFDPKGQREGGRDDAPRMFTTYVPTGDPRTAHVSAIQRDPSGGLWVGTAAGLFHAAVTGTAVAFAPVDLKIPDVLQARAIGALRVDRFGALWIGAYGRVYRRGSGGDLIVLGAADGIPRESVSAMVDDHQGSIWITPLGGGLLRITDDGVTRPRLVRHLTARDGFPGGGAFDLMQDSRGTLWVATAGALVGVTARPGNERPDLQIVGEPEGLRAQGLSALAEDLDGNLWAGVVPYGVAKLSRSGFTTFAPGDPRAAFISLIEAQDGGLVAFARTAGRLSAYRYDGQSFTPEAGAYPDVTASWAWNQMALQDRFGAWWVGGTEGVVRYKPGVSLHEMASATPVARYSTADGLPANTVIRLFEDRRGDVWIGTVGEGVTRNGLTRWRPGAPALASYTEEDGLPPLDRYYVSAFAGDRAGDVWIGFSGDAGLVRYDGTRFVRFTSTDGVALGQIRNLTPDAAGRLWAATYRGGVVRIDQPEREHPIFRSYTTRDGLSSNETMAIVEAAPGHMFIGTARGLDKLMVATGEFTHFTKTDGLPGIEMWGALRDVHGALWFVYSDAILRLTPDTAQPTSPAPQVLVSGISVDGRARDVSAVGDVHITDLRIPSEASMRVDLVAPWFGTLAGMLYQYRLRPEDPWSAPSLQRSVTFANLTPGRYTFSARAITADGRSSGSSATVAFTVIAPVWRRGWFVLLALSVLGGLGYIISRRRVERLLEFANMRTRIATDLHDDIGANLTRISVLSEVARQRHALTSAADDPLASIAALSRESVTAMGDIVWAINPERDHVGDLVRKMREHADELLSARDVQLTFTIVGALQDERIDLDVRRDVFLIFKEAINNAARHSHCSTVAVTFGTEHGSLVLSITDDGAGFDRGADTEGNGLVNMQRRAARIGGSLDVRSHRGSGTTIRLIMPLKPRRRSRRLPL